MSTSHRRFEALEPRVLLSGMSFLTGHLPTARPSSSPMAVRPEEIPAARQEDRAGEFPPLPDPVSNDSPPVVDRSATQEPAIDSHDEPPAPTSLPPSIPSQQQPSENVVVDAEPPVEEPPRPVVPPDVSQPLMEAPTDSARETETAVLVDTSTDPDTTRTTRERVLVETPRADQAEAPQLDSNQCEVASDVVESAPLPNTSPDTAETRVIKESSIVEPQSPAASDTATRRSEIQDPEPTTVAVEPVEPYDRPSDDNAVSINDDVAVRKPASEASTGTAPARETESATNTTPASDDADARKSLAVTAAEPAPGAPEVVQSRVEPDTSDDGRSGSQQPQRSRTEADATEETSSVRKPATADQSNGVLSATGETAEQGALNDEGLAETDSCAADNEPGGAVTSETAPAPATTIKTTSPDPASNDPAASPCEPAAMEANQPAASAAPTSTPTGSSSAAARYDSNQDNPEDGFGKLVECVFAEEGSEPGDSQRAASQTLPVTEGALLVVALGKPLTRLAAGGEPVDAMGMDCGSPGTRATGGRSRRDRRNTAEARSRPQRRKDTRDVTWLPFDRSANSRPQIATQSSGEQAGDLRPSAEPISPGLADLAVFSQLAVSMSEDGSRSSESRSPILPSRAAWNDYGLLGVAATATLAGTVSVLAVERSRRLQSHRPCVGLPKPTYTGPTLSRVV